MGGPRLPTAPGPWVGLAWVLGGGWDIRSWQRGAPGEPRSPSKGSCWCRTLHGAMGSERKGPPSDLPCEGADSCPGAGRELFLSIRRLNVKDPPGGSGVSLSSQRPCEPPCQPATALLGILLPVLCQRRGPSSAQKIQVQIWGGVTVRTSRSKQGMVGRRGSEAGRPQLGTGWGTSKQSETLDSTEAGDRRWQPGPGLVPHPSVPGRLSPRCPGPPSLSQVTGRV